MPVKYASRLAQLQVVGKTLDQLFDDLFYDKTEEGKALLKRKYRNNRNTFKGRSKN